MLVLFTDTDTDVTPVEAEEYGYHLISMPYSIGDEITYPYVDFEKFDGHAFYQKLREGVLPTTSALNPIDYKNYFEPFFKNGDDILYVHFSRAMSGTFNSLNLALEDLKKEYPDRKVYLIDTKGITLGSYTIVLEIGKLVKNGASIEEVMKWSETEIDKYAVYFFADDLKFFRRSGRVSGLAATMGGLIGIKPIINMNSDGIMGSIGKERGRKNAIARLVQYVVDLGDDVKNHPIVIGHCDNIDLVNLLVSELKQTLGDDFKYSVHEVNPTAGSHCGPDTVGISFHAIHR